MPRGDHFIRYHSQPQALNVKQHEATLYTRDGCHLCEQAHELLLRYKIPVTTVNIDSDPALKARYNDCVPVIWIDGRERFRGHVDGRLLQRILRAAGD